LIFSPNLIILSLSALSIDFLAIGQICSICLKNSRTYMNGKICFIIFEENKQSIYETI